MLTSVDVAITTVNTTTTLSISALDELTYLCIVCVQPVFTLG